MLVVGVKGQWNAALFTAVQMQLADRYALHPTVEEQGVYLLLWFGADEKIAGLKKHENLQARDLEKKLEDSRLSPRSHFDVTRLLGLCRPQLS
jgi:hypothetical protein